MLMAGTNATNLDKDPDMLPYVKTTAIAALTAAAVFTTSLVPANALGRDERKFIQGAVAAIIVDQLLEGARDRRGRAPVYAPQYAPRQPVYAPQPHYEPQYQPQRTSIYSTPAARAFNSYGRGERIAIQQRLRAMGYYRSSIDGSFGPGTYNAILAYAQDSGLGNRLGSTNTAFGVYDSLIY
jgi:Putative peptidoglycan binding domain